MNKELIIDLLKADIEHYAKAAIIAAKVHDIKLMGWNEGYAEACKDYLKKIESIG